MDRIGYDMESHWGGGRICFWRNYTPFIWMPNGTINAPSWRGRLVIESILDKTRQLQAMAEIEGEIMSGKLN